MPNFDPLYLSMNNTPPAILAVMDDLRARHDQQRVATGKLSGIPWLLVVAGVLFGALDWVLGYDGWLFVIVGVGCIIAAIVAGRVLRRSRVRFDFSPHFQATRTVIHTLRDDISPRRNCFGYLDLTGAEQPAKLMREGQNMLGLATALYRDEWLSLKLKLYDGNMLRVSAVERMKVRKGYYKRGTISGKQKWKPPKDKSMQELRVRLSVNPDVYSIAANPAAYVGKAIGQYTITMLDLRGGIIQLAAATTSQSITEADILGVLHVIYTSLLQRKALP